MARPSRPENCDECEEMLKASDEPGRACWYGRVCPFKVIDEDPEVAVAYGLARYAVRIEEREDPKSKVKTREVVWDREGVKFACWLHALKSAKDRTIALDLIVIVGTWMQTGIEWFENLEMARMRKELGEMTEEDRAILVCDEDLIDG